MENENRYPLNVIDPALKEAEAHYTGMIVGGAFWHLKKQIGTKAAFELIYEAMQMFPPDATFFDVRDTLLLVDSRMNAGAHRQQITEQFARHGISSLDPVSRGSISILSLATMSFNNALNRYEVKDRFRKGETIFVLADYRATGVTPGYNMIAEDAQLQGPAPGSADTVFIADNIVNGTHRGPEAIAFASIATSDTTATGSYTLSMRPRIGGQTKLGTRKSISFTIE